VFKSYYVVWKRSGAVRAYEKFILFKSYYVVWKPMYVSFPASSS